MNPAETIGTAAAVCTTVAFIPQISKIVRKKSGEDLSYGMLFVYLTGVLLWLVYGLLLRAQAIIWANLVTSLLVAVAIGLKAYYSAAHQGGKRARLGGMAPERD